MDWEAAAASARALLRARSAVRARQAEANDGCRLRVRRERYTPKMTGRDAGDKAIDREVSLFATKLKRR